MAVLGGITAALAFVGFAVLADGLRAAAPGIPPSGSPTDVADTLPWPGLHSSAGTVAVVAALLAVLGVGGLAGAAGRRRLPRGLVVLLGLDGVLTALWWVNHPAGWIAAVVATTASVLTYLAVLRVPTPRRRPTHRAVAATRDGTPATPGAGLPPVVLSRRKLLAIGALVAAAAGVSGLLVRSSTAPRLTASRALDRGVVPAPDSAPLLNGEVFDVKAFGAVGDGVQDDGDAVRRALTAANAAGGTLFFPEGTYLYRGTGSLQPAARLTLSGVPGASTIKYDAGGTDYAEFCSIVADGVTLDGLAVERVGGSPAVLVGVGPVAGLTLSRMRLVGNQTEFPDAFCHGIKLSDSGIVSGFRFVDSFVTGMQYGLFQTNASTALVTDVLVERCTFERNQNTDLEFNSPQGLTRQVTVQNCHFADNDSEGFAVGLAHVQGAVVRANSFDTYGLEAVHVEDYSEDVAVSDNGFVDCGLRDHSFVQVISRCRDVRVTGNTFRARRNANPIYVVNALPGGTEITPGGREPGPPSDVVVRDNRFECVARVVPVYFQEVQGGSIASNTIDGTEIRGPGDAFRLLDDPGSAVSGNTINGTVF